MVHCWCLLPNQTSCFIIHTYCLTPGFLAKCLPCHSQFEGEVTGEQAVVRSLSDLLTFQRPAEQPVPLGAGFPPNFLDPERRPLSLITNQIMIIAKAHWVAFYVPRCELCALHALFHIILKTTHEVNMIVTSFCTQGSRLRERCVHPVSIRNV